MIYPRQSQTLRMGGLASRAELPPQMVNPPEAYGPGDDPLVDVLGCLGEHASLPLGFEVDPLQSSFDKSSDGEVGYQEGMQKNSNTPGRVGLPQAPRWLRGVVTANQAGATISVNLRDEQGSAVVVTALIPNGGSWDECLPQYMADDPILVLETPDKQYFTGPFITYNQIRQVFAC